MILVFSIKSKETDTQIHNHGQKGPGSVGRVERRVAVSQWSVSSRKPEGLFWFSRVNTRWIQVEIRLSSMLCVDYS